MDRLKGKIALIAGAGTGVGRACMKLFAAEGAKVVGVSRTKANLDETLAQVKAAGGDGRIVAADLSTPDGAEQAVAETLATFGRIDILVNSAGVGYSWLEKSPGSMGPVDDTTPEKWAEVMAINLDSVFHMCRLVIPQMKKQGGGSIVNVTSISGFQGLPAAHTTPPQRGRRSISPAPSESPIAATTSASIALLRDLSIRRWSPRCSASSTIPRWLTA